MKGTGIGSTVARFTQVIPLVYIVDDGFIGNEGINGGQFQDRRLPAPTISRSASTSTCAVKRPTARTTPPI